MSSGPDNSKKQSLRTPCATDYIGGDQVSERGTAGEPDRPLLAEGERDRAVELGAQAIPARKAGKLERQPAAVRGEAQP
jgi:hypothetical protein